MSEIRFADGTTWTAEDVNAMSPVLRAPEGGGSVSGYDTDDTLIGSDKADLLRGSGGNDLLIGNKGNDRLEGGEGDDTYVWAPGDGNDTICDGAGRNVLKIGEGVDPSKVEVSRDSYHLYLTFKDTGEKLRLQNWYYDTSYRVSEIRFADGTTWTAEDVNAMSPVLRAPEGGGSVSGYDTDDTLIGSDKADSLRGNGGNDLLIGNKGDDTLEGGAGDDTLIGGTGNDRLEGGAGDDTYVWAPGDGNDTIFDGVGRNVLKIGEGVDPSKVEVSRDGSHLYLRFKDTGEKLTLQYWYGGVSYQMSAIQFADGTVWTAEDVNHTMESGTSGSTPFMSPMQLQAALDDFGASAPASLLSMSAMSEAMGPEDYAGAQLRMDVAVAGLAFDSAELDKVIDFSAVASSANANALTVSMASENDLERHFERKR